jgi:hypothetical protein
MQTIKCVVRLAPISHFPPPLGVRFTSSLPLLRTLFTLSPRLQVVGDGAVGKVSSPLRVQGFSREERTRVER